MLNKIVEPTRIENMLEELDGLIILKTWSTMNVIYYYN